jgi:hypothetical protein
METILKISGTNINEIYEKTKSLFLELGTKNYVGCKFKYECMEKEILKELSILLENDGFLIDLENNIIIWDKDIKTKYFKNVNSICQRICRKNKENCCGCMEYKYSSKFAGYMIDYKILIL